MNNLLADSGSQSEEPTTPGGKGRGQEEDTMLEIVLGQRERFRKRVAESEEENKSLKEALGELTNTFFSFAFKYFPSKEQMVLLDLLLLLTSLKFSPFIVCLFVCLLLKFTIFVIFSKFCC